MLRLIILCLSLAVAGCVSLDPRYAYHPETAKGIQCKTNCRALFDSCRQDARDRCNQTAGALAGGECTDWSLALGDEVNACIAEEEDCLRMCERLGSR